MGFSHLPTSLRVDSQGKADTLSLAHVPSASLARALCLSSIIFGLAASECRLDHLSRRSTHSRPTVELHAEQHSSSAREDPCFSQANVLEKLTWNKGTQFRSWLLFMNYRLKWSKSHSIKSGSFDAVSKGLNPMEANFHQKKTPSWVHALIPSFTCQFVFT